MKLIISYKIPSWDKNLAKSLFSVVFWQKQLALLLIFLILDLDLLSKSLVEVSNLIKGELCLAQRARVIVPAPLLYALSVEVVADIARQRSHHLRLAEVAQANTALSVLRELEWVEGP